MKKAIKIIAIILGTVIGVVIIAAVAFLIAVHDNTNHTPASIAEKNPELMEVVNEAATHALSDAQSNSDIILTLDGTTINKALYGTLTRLTGLGVVSFKGAYANFLDSAASGSELYVEIPTKVCGVSTCVYATAVITDSNQKLSVKLENAKIGKFSCTSGLMKTFIVNDSLGNNLEEALAGIGLDVDIDMDTLTIETTHEAIASMICRMTASDPNASLYQVVAELCLTTPELLEIRTEAASVEAVLHTEQMTYSETRDGKITYLLDMSSVKSAVESNEHMNYKNVGVLYNAYTKGYDQLSDEDKAVADECGVSSSVKGIKTATGLSIAAAVLTQKPSLSLLELLTNQSYSIYIESKTADAILANLSFIGSCIPFTDGSETAYILVEALSVNIDEDTLHVCLIMNLNGRRIALNIDGSCPAGTGESLDVTVTKICFGSYEVNGKYITGILSYLNSVLASQNWITPNPDTNSIRLSLSEILDESDGFDILRDNCDSTGISLVSDRLRVTYYFIKK